MSAGNLSSAYYNANGAVYQPFELFNRIDSMHYDVIAGLDFGHGESVVFKSSRQNGNWMYSLIGCGENGETEVATYLSYEDDGTKTIGLDATDNPHFFQYFKRAPAQWHVIADQKGHTIRDVIRDYIGELWNNARSMDTAIRESQEGSRLLLAVGCPSSDEWTNEESQTAFVNLIAEATGCNASDIFILPESNAAIMVPIFSEFAGKETKRVDCGVAIYDFGSSTIDYTYVYMGKKLVVRSLQLGGSDIDKAMLRRVCAQSGISPDELSSEDLNKMYVRLRKLKEDFYNRNRHSSGLQRFQFQDKSQNYEVDDAFMHAVLTEDREVMAYDQNYHGLSWIECVKHFLKNNRALLVGYPCETVVLTGGCSRVSDINRVCSAVYGADKLMHEDKPEASVAKGLCYAIGLGIRSKPLIDEIRQHLQLLIDDRYQILARCFANRLYNKHCAVNKVVIQDFLNQNEKNQNEKNYLEEELIEAIQARLNTQSTRNECLSALSEILFDTLEYVRADIRTEVNRLSAELYGQELQTPPELPDIQIEKIRELLWDSLNMEKLLRKMTENDSFSSVSLLYFFTTACFKTVLRMLFPTNDLFSKKNDTLLKIITAKPKISAKELNKSLMQLDHPNTRTKKTATIVELLENQELFSEADGQNGPTNLHEFFDGIAIQLLETAIGQVLFMLYEEKPE